VREAGGVGTSIISVPLTLATTGIVDVQTGTLALSGDSTYAGTLQGAGTLAFAGGTHTLTNTSSVTTGAVQVSAGTVTVHGLYDLAASTTVATATLTFAPGSVPTNLGDVTLNPAGIVALNSGQVGGVTVPTLTLNSGTLTGTDDLTVTGAMTWS